MRVLTVVLFVSICLPIVAAGESGRYWVYFTDKGQENLEVSKVNPGSVLSQQAIQRRHLRAGSSRLSSSDLPPSEDYIRQLKNHGIKIHQISHWLNAVSCYLNAGDIKIIAQLNFVQHVVAVKTLHRTLPEIERAAGGFFKSDSSQYGPSLNQNQMLNIPAAHAAGYSGRNVLIAVFDTGFLLNHEALQHLQIVDTWDFIHNDPDVGNDPGDAINQHNHGTEVLGVLAGYRAGQLIGPAYNARFMLAKTEDLLSETHLEEDNWVAAAEWAERAGADIITTSVGYDYSVGYTYEEMDGNTAIITRAADLAVRKGVAVLSSGGNEGQTAWKYIVAPADGDSVIAVGGVRPDRSYWPTSSQGPTYDGRIKPDLAAQAQQVYTLTPGTVNSYQYVNGTSFSCPLVTGCAAILLSEMPHFTPIALRDTLKRYASQYAHPDNFVGSGLVDMGQIVSKVLNSPAISLRSFTGIPATGRNVLNWTADWENGNEKWILRRHSDDNEYQTIAEIKSKRTESVANVYAFADFEISGGERLFYQLSALLQNGQQLYLDSLSVISLGPEEQVRISSYPNPFNEKTRLIFGLSQAQSASLSIYNLRGQRVRSLIDNQFLEARYHQVIWDATNDAGNTVSSGNYFVRLETENGKKSIKILYLR